MTGKLRAAHPATKRRNEIGAVAGRQAGVHDGHVGQMLGAARERGVHVGHRQRHHAVLGQHFLDGRHLALVRRDHQHARARDQATAQRRDLGHRRRARAPGDVNLEALARGEHVQPAARLGGPGPGDGLHAIHHRVVVRRIVMEQGQALDAGGLGHVGGVLDRRVAPAHAIGVLLVGVLGIVDDEVGAAQERDVPLIAGMVQDAVLRLPERLVVGHVGDGGAAVGHPVGDGGRGVVQVLRLHQHVADPEEAFLELGEVDALRRSRSLTGK